MILEGAVKVNGKYVEPDQLGMQVEPERDVVTVRGKRVTLGQEKIYLMLNKPLGCVSTCHDDRGRMTVLDCIKG